MCKELANTPPDILNGAADCMGLEEQNLAHCRRIILLGDAGSGKTTLVKALCSGSKQLADEETGGIGIHLLRPFKDIDRDNPADDVDSKLDHEDDRLLWLQFWDVSNRKIWQRCQSLFLLQQSVCVIVFNVTDQSTIRSVLQHLEFIQAKVPCSHVVVIGTHADKINDEEQLKHVCSEILKDIEDKFQRRQEELQKELDALSDIPGEKGKKVHTKIEHLNELLKQSRPPPSTILTSSNASPQDVDTIKKSIFEAVLQIKHQSNGIQSISKDALSTFYQQISSLRKESHVVVSKDTLCMTTPAAVGNNSKEKRQSKTKAKQEEKLLSYLKDTGAILEVNSCNRIHSLSSRNDDTKNNSNTSPINSTNAEDQKAPISSLICINPVVLAQAVFAVHVDNTKAAFKFEANRFWPKSEGVKKPSPSVLVQALEEIATQGLIRECLFPLLWQNLSLTEAQIILVIDFLCSQGILVRELLPASDEPDCQCLKLPHYGHLSTQQQYRLPYLDLLLEQGPSLNWMPKPLEGDIQITWRYEFLGSNPPPGMTSRLLAYCYNHCPIQAVYQHYWTNGLLMKIGQVCIHMSQSVDKSSLHFTGRITTDEEGEDKATQMIWVALSHFLLCAHHYLQHWPGLEYKVSLVPSKDYYTSTISDEDTIEVPLLLCLQMISQGQHILDVVADDSQCKVHLNTLLPLTGDSNKSLEDWLLWLSVQQVALSDQTSTPDDTHIEETTARDESSYMASPNTKASKSSKVASSPKVAPSPSKDKVVAKKKEIKWDLGPRITEEQQIKEAKKVAASFVAAVVAGAMAQYICEEMQGPMAEAAAKASAQAAKAAQSGDPEAAARAVIAAAQAVSNTSGNKGVAKVTRSKLCIIV